jgi:2'-5' RNA ligase
MEETMLESIRSFLAFDIDSPLVVERFIAAQRGLIQTGADVKVVEPQNIHVTVRFLGEITMLMVERVFEEMKKLSFKPFTVSIVGLGAFPDMNRPRVVWAGIEDGKDELSTIFNQLEPRLRALGFAADPKGFSPHLTIARVRSSVGKDKLVSFLKSNSKFDFGAFRVSCLRLKKSVLLPKGPVYSTIKEVCVEP